MRTLPAETGNGTFSGQCFLVKWVPDRGPEQRESIKTVLYLLIIIIIIIIILISYIIIQLLIKMRAIPAETGNGTFSGQCCQLTFCPQSY
jgi:hypothetical protein